MSLPCIIKKHLLPLPPNCCSDNSTKIAKRCKLSIDEKIIRKLCINFVIK